VGLTVTSCAGYQQANATLRSELLHSFGIVRDGRYAAAAQSG